MEQKVYLLYFFFLEYREGINLHTGTRYYI